MSRVGMTGQTVIWRYAHTGIRNSGWESKCPVERAEDEFCFPSFFFLFYIEKNREREREREREA